MLVNGDGRAVLSDFGLSRVPYGGSSGLTTTRGGSKGTTRWCSPEILNGEAGTPQSDMWAWGCLVLEVRRTLFLAFPLRR